MNVIEKRKPMYYWTLDLCQKDALKYNTKAEWKKNSPGYKKAMRMKWLAECCKHMDSFKKPNGYWTLDKCKIEALNYSTRAMWKSHSDASYVIAGRNGWLEECCTHMELLWEQKWTLLACQKEALNYRSRTEWKHSGHGYDAAVANDWLEFCCNHMKQSRTVSLAESDLLSIIQSKHHNAKKQRMQVDNFFPDRPLIKRFELDIYIPELRKGIEFNGDYWHSNRGLSRSRLRKGWPKEDINNYHQLKKEFFTAKGINYIEIWEKDWKANQQECIERCLEFLTISTT